jgi:hypothetical protein
MKVKSAFLRDTIPLDVKYLVPSRVLDARERNHQKYKQIAASIDSVGIIEPLVIFPAGKGLYRVLDGCKRLDILLAKKIDQVDCLIATDDESYTYNKRTNYLSPVSEHLMILKALKYNTEQTIAKALAVDVGVIRRKRDLLRGICPEAVGLLTDRRATPAAFSTLRKMKPTRQIEVAQLMIASSVYSGRFANALLAGTRDDLLVEAELKRIPNTVPESQKLKMQQETDSLLRTLKAVEASYGEEVLGLSVACRYLGRVLSNPGVLAYLTRCHAALLGEIQSIVASLEEESVSV